ncbi:Ornithine/DAP/Arg decarboxylase [Corchorus capsularis]|uniref:ornithine decarboxylase n=1 Tax=Corchorus capsularis TaxID=210143 RepID=A0A1R3JWB0_COCAP|nr:Ornithine/DAP/Arg decarboxylase [Corchorus capsularis]
MEPPTVQPKLVFHKRNVELGSNFDCSNLAEIEALLSLGVSPDRIIFANPCKAESHIKYAASVGVNLTTFDSEEELVKIQKWHPKCRLLIRIKAPETSGAKFPLGAKFGALPEEVVPLLQATQARNLNIVGVSFHIGSGAIHFQAFDGAIAAAKIVFEQAAQLCMPKMHILNIGGGFSAGPQFTEAASAVKNALQKYFPNDSDSNLIVIAEPGRFFAELPFTLATSIIGKRVNPLKKVSTNSKLSAKDHVQSRFSQEEQVALQSLQTLFGSKIVNSCMIVVFTGGNELEEDEETLEEYLSRDSSALALCLEVPHYVGLNGMSNILECVVLPHGIIAVATPDIALADSIRSLDL